MKAFVFEKYGLPEQVLRIEEVKRPQPKENEVLVKIKATTINDFDWSIVRGKPYLLRLMYGISKPRFKISGMELSGIIEEIGTKVTAKKVGEAVYGDISNFGFGTFAEYICVPENEVLHKPDELSFEVAASLPHASTLALQALQDLGNIQKDQKILINGGGGGVGSIGLQLAKNYNCQVTGVDSGPKLEMMKKLGFDELIDYTKINFTKNGELYDLILDCKTTKPPLSFLKVLKENGTYVSIGGKISNLIRLLFWSKMLPMFSSKKLLILSLKPNDGLAKIEELILKNQLKTQIDGPYPFEEIPRLIQYFGEGLHQGKIVVTLK